MNSTSDLLKQVGKVSGVVAAAIMEDSSMVDCYRVDAFSMESLSESSEAAMDMVVGLKMIKCAPRKIVLYSRDFNTTIIPVGQLNGILLTERGTGHSLMSLAVKMMRDWLEAESFEDQPEDCTV